jgi:hypothetical protein
VFASDLEDRFKRMKKEVGSKIARKQEKISVPMASYFVKSSANYIKIIYYDL